MSERMSYAEVEALKTRLPSLEWPFLVFAGDNYYPSGGWNDYAGAWPTLEEAKFTAMRLPSQWAQIIDMRTGEDVSDA